MISPSDYIYEGTLRILVKPGKRDNKITGFDHERKALIVEIKTVAQENKANLEVVKYFSKLLKKEVRIKSGLTSKEKVLQVGK